MDLDTDSNNKIFGIGRGSPSPTRQEEVVISSPSGENEPNLKDIVLQMQKQIQSLHKKWILFLINNKVLLLVYHL